MGGQVEKFALAEARLLRLAVELGVAQRHRGDVADQLQHVEVVGAEGHVTLPTEQQDGGDLLADGERQHRDMQRNIAPRPEHLG